MRNPPIVRAVVSDIYGDTLFDSADAPIRRPRFARPVVVRSRAAMPPPVAAADPGGRALSALLAGLAVALVYGAICVAIALVAA